MLNQLAVRRDEDEGFTLIELMVVVLIIGILMAIAIPTFLGAKNSANARAVQSNLRNAVTAEQSYFSGAGNQVYGTYSQVSVLENALQFSALTSTAPAPAAGVNNLVYVGTPGTDANGASTVELGAKGQDGHCYYVFDDAGAVSYYTQTACAAPPTGATASASGSQNVWGTTW